MKVLNLSLLKGKLPNLSVVKKTADSGEKECYYLYNTGKQCVCSFDFTNFMGIDRYLSHGEIKNFNIPKIFRRKKNGASAILYANELVTKSAKEKNIDFIYFKFPIDSINGIRKDLLKLFERMGFLRYCVEDLYNERFIKIINPNTKLNLLKRSSLPYSDLSNFNLCVDEILKISKPK